MFMENSRTKRGGERKKKQRRGKEKVVGRVGKLKRKEEKFGKRCRITPSVGRE